MDYKEFLKQKIEEQNQKNISEFNSYLNSQDTKIKIQNLREKFPDLNFDNLIEDAKNGNHYAIALLRKDPKKQNISEKAFFEFTGLEKIPQCGENAVRFNGSKAMDFKINDWFGTQKFIEEPGGAQDNQINDAITFAVEANKAGHKAIICVDGEYGEKILKESEVANKNLIICNADELKEGIISGRFN